MNYVVEDINFSTKKLIFDFGEEEIEAFDFESRIQRLLKEKQKSTALKGFRQGKVPLGMIKKLYGPDMERNIFQDFMFNKIQNAVEKESLEVVNILPVEGLQYERGKSLSFKVDLEIVPTIELKDISEYVFTQGDTQVTDQEFDKFLKDTWLLPAAEMKEATDEGVVLGEDNVGIVNYKGMREDGTVEMTETEYWVDSYRKDIIQGLREGALGMKKGEKKSLELVMADDYREEKLRGVKLFFDVELLEIKEKVLPELDDKLAVENGFENIEEMKKNVRKKMLEKKQEYVENKLRSDIEERLIEDNPFEVPEKLIEKREKAIRKSIKSRLDELGYDRKNIRPYMEANKKNIREQAIKTIKLSLSLRSLIKKYGIEIFENESDRSIEDKVFKKILENVTVHQDASS